MKNKKQPDQRLRNFKRCKVDRRHFMKGVGIAVGLPLLDCMTPAFANSSSAIAPPKRMLLLSNNLGVLPGPFFPKQSGKNYKLSPYLEHLQEFRNDFSVFSGLSHPNVDGGHSTENCFLTAAKDPTGSGFRNTISLDQFAADRVGQRTRFPTLNLGININKANRSLSWTRDGVLLPAQDSPAQLFRKMFVQGNKSSVKKRIHELDSHKSILDVLLDDAQRFQKTLGPQDKQRVDQYFNSIRQLEKRLIESSSWESKPKPTTTLPEPKDILDRSQFFEKFELMLAMARIAFESDSTRIITLMADAFATPVFGISKTEKSLIDYHNLSHHGQAKNKIEQLERVDQRQMNVLNRLFAGLADKKEGNVRLLDSTMILFGSNMGDANVHNNTNLPILLAGGGFRHGQHHAFDSHDNTPLSNLFVNMLQQFGVEADKFGSSTGTLANL